MRTVTVEQFIGFQPCWLETYEDGEYIHEDEATLFTEYIAPMRNKWTVWDVLELYDEYVSAEDKLWAVLREEFINDKVLHEFGCRCLEYELSKTENAQSRIAEYVAVKRDWIQGMVSDDVLQEAYRSVLRERRELIKDCLSISDMSTSVHSKYMQLTLILYCLYRNSRECALNLAYRIDLNVALEILKALLTEVYGKECR